MKEKSKRNPQDLTLRNLRAMKKEIARQRRAIDIIILDLDALWRRVHGVRRKDNEDMKQGPRRVNKG